MRYGNKAFRSWHNRLLNEAVPLCQQILDSHTVTSNSSSSTTASTETNDITASSSSSSSSSSNSSSVTGPAVELAAYLVDSFGNSTRIDYGTGHETTFLLFLYCLCKLGHIHSNGLASLGLRAFPAYLRVCRKLQRTYWLEPAGSHGVWSLDDYHFLVFLFGSAQLLNHKHIKPKSIHSKDILEGYAKDYMYLNAIAFISEVKVGAPFAEHSPILNDIGELPNWGKVNEGLARMYKAEVLGKLPVVQHFTFGSVLQATWQPSRTPTPSDATAHLYGSLDGISFNQLHSPSGADEIPLDHTVTAVAPWTTEPICTHRHHPHEGSSNGIQQKGGNTSIPFGITGVAPWANSNNNNRQIMPPPSSSFHDAFGNIKHIHANQASPEKGGSPKPSSPRSTNNI